MPTFTITDAGCVFTATAEEQAELLDMIEAGYHWDTLCQYAFEYSVCNGLSWVNPKDIGALTSSLIFSDSSPDDNDAYPPDADFFWFPSYQILDPIDVLARDGRVLFARAPLDPVVQEELDAFTVAYIACALWASTDDEGEPLDASYDPSDLSDEARLQLERDCRAFYLTNRADCLAHGTPERCGHDFWLTRNRHGAGFWDRGTGDVGQRLTDAAHVYGSCDLYVGDDGKLYAT